MSRRFLLIAAGGALAVAAGGLVMLLAGGVRRAPASADTSLAAVLQRAGDGDSVAIARATLARCASRKDDGRRDCYADVLLGLVREGRIRLAMGVLGRLQEADPEVPRRGHDLSHVVGINAWQPGKPLGPVYAQCTELFQSGCYHGVIQAYFAWSGIDSATVAGVCDAAPEIRDSPWLRFQCVHGVGHGLVQTRKLDLPRALQGCDQLHGWFDQESCYGGAFMEFILGSRGQDHHPAAGPEPEHEAHGHGTASDSAPPFRHRDPNDPLYPCTAVGERYQRACYELQAGIIYEFTRGDLAGLSRACDGAPVGFRPSCYQGIGTYITGLTTRDASRTVEICRMGHPDYREWCFVGVVKNFVDVTSRAEDGLDYCRRLEEGSLRTRCYVAVGEQVHLLHQTTADRERACSGAEPAYVAACRYGARLTPDRPAALRGI